MASQEKWLWTYAVSIHVNDTSELFLWNIERLTVLGASALPELQTVPEVELLNVLNACFFCVTLKPVRCLFEKCDHNLMGMSKLEERLGYIISILYRFWL